CTCSVESHDHARDRLAVENDRVPRSEAGFFERTTRSHVEDFRIADDPTYRRVGKHHSADELTDDDRSQADSDHLRIPDCEIDAGFVRSRAEFSRMRRVFGP